MTYTLDYFKSLYLNLNNQRTLDITNNNILLNSFTANNNLNIIGITTSPSLFINSSLTNLNNINTNNITCSDIITIGFVNKTININNNIYAIESTCNNITSITNLTINITGSAYINNIISNSNSNIYISNTSIINKLQIKENLLISGLVQSNNVISENLNIASTLLVNNVVSSNLLYADNIIVGVNTTCQKDIKTNILNCNNNICNMLNVANNTIFNDDVTISSFYTNTNISISNILKMKTITVNSIIFTNMKEFKTNTDSLTGYTSIFDVYKLGDLLKTRIDNIYPSISLNGYEPSIIYENSKYTELGIAVVDETIITTYIISIYYNNVNYISNPILFTSGIVITAFDTTKIGKHIITYRIYDYEKNYRDITRIVFVYTIDKHVKIILNGLSEIDIGINEVYVEYNGKVYNNILQEYPTITGSVDTSKVGTYLIKYETIGESNNTHYIHRVVNVCNKYIANAYDFKNAINTKLTYTNTSFNNLLQDTSWSMECCINIQNSGSFNGIIKIMELGIFFIGIGRDTSISNNFYITYRGVTNSTAADLATGVDTYTSKNVYKLIIGENKWYTIKFKRDNLRLKIYIDNILHEIVSISSNITEYDNVILDISKLSINFNNSVLYGIISNPKIYNGNNELIFYLNNNFVDDVSNNTLVLENSINVMPVITTRDYLVRDLASTTLPQTDLIFYFKPEKIKDTNWVDELGKVTMASTQNYSSVYLTQNNYGWGSTLSSGWKIANNTYLKTIKWLNGMTLAFWVYIDARYVYDSNNSLIGSNKTLLQADSLSYPNGYGFSIGPPNITTNCLPYIYLNYNTYQDFNKLLKSYSNFYDKGIPIDELKGKWTHIVITSDTGYKSGTVTTELKIYKNGELFNKIKEAEFISTSSDYWARPDNPILGDFVYGHSSDSVQSTNIINKLLLGELMMYNRILGEYEVKDLYTYNKNNYIIASYIPASIYSYQELVTTLIPHYDLSNGYVSHNIDFDIIKLQSRFTIEFWLYFTGDITTQQSIVNISNVFDLTIGVFNTTYKYISFSINSTSPTDENTVYTHTSFILEQNKWYHFCLSKLDALQLFFYINGVSKPLTITSSKKTMLYDISYINKGYHMKNIKIGNSSNNYNISQFKISKNVYDNLYKVLYNYSDFIPPINLVLDKNTLYYLEGNKDLISNQTITFIGVVNIVTDPIGTSTLTLNGESDIVLYKNLNTYTELGATVNLTFRPFNVTNVTIINKVDTTNIGYYINEYKYYDENIYLIIYRRIRVILYTLPPDIILIGLATIKLKLNDPYVEQGVTVTDLTGEIISAIITGQVLVNQIGVYTITYTATNSFGNTRQITRIVTVKIFPVLIFSKIKYTGLDDFNELSGLSSPQSSIMFKTLYFNNMYFRFPFNYHSRSGNGPPYDSLYAISTDKINWTVNTYFTNIFPGIDYCKIMGVVTTSRYIVLLYHNASIPSNLYMYRSHDGINWIGPYILPINNDWPYTTLVEANDVLFIITRHVNVHLSSNHGDNWNLGAASFYCSIYNGIQGAVYTNNYYVLMSSQNYIVSTNLINWTVTKPANNILELADTGIYRGFRPYTITTYNNYILTTGYSGTSEGFIVYSLASDIHNWKYIKIICPAVDNPTFYTIITPIVFQTSPIHYINDHYYLIGNFIFSYTDINGVGGKMFIKFEGVSDDVVNWLFRKNYNDIILPDSMTTVQRSNIFSNYNSVSVLGSEYNTSVINNELFVTNTFYNDYYYQASRGRGILFQSFVQDYGIYGVTDYNNTIVTPIYEFTGGDLYDNYWDITNKSNGTIWLSGDSSKSPFVLNKYLSHGFSISMTVDYNGYGWYTQNNILYNTGSVAFFMFGVSGLSTGCGIKVSGNNMYFYSTNNTYLQLNTSISIIGENNWIFSISRNGYVQIYKNGILVLNENITFNYKLLQNNLTLGYLYSTTPAYLRYSTISNVKVWDKVISWNDVNFPVPKDPYTPLVYNDMSGITYSTTLYTYINNTTNALHKVTYENGINESTLIPSYCNFPVANSYIKKFVTTNYTTIANNITTTKIKYISSLLTTASLFTIVPSKQYLASYGYNHAKSYCMAYKMQYDFYGMDINFPMLPFNLFYDVDPPRTGGIAKFNGGNNTLVGVTYENATQIFTLELQSNALKIRMYVNNLSTIPIILAGISLDSYLYNTVGTETYHALYTFPSSATQSTSILSTAVSGTLGTGFVLSNYITTSLGYFYKIFYDSTNKKLHHSFYNNTGTLRIKVIMNNYDPVYLFSKRINKTETEYIIPYGLYDDLNHYTGVGKRYYEGVVYKKTDIDSAINISSLFPLGTVF